MGQFKSTLFPTILVALISSGSGECQASDSDQLTTTATISDETQNDSKHWLKDSKGVRCIFEDSKGNLWFSNREFVCKYDGTRFKYFDEKDGFIGTPGRVQEDAEGLIWVANNIGDSAFGVSSYDGKKFTYHPLVYRNDSTSWRYSENDIWINKGVKHFGNTEGPPGVYRYHDGEFTFLAFPVPRVKDAANLYLGTTGAIKGQDGTLWFGTFEAAIGFKGDSFTIIDREKLGLKDDPRNIGIRTLCADSKGNLWIGDNGFGVFIYNGDSIINFTKLHHLDKGDKEGNTLHRIFSIAEDDAGNMWFGTVYSGIWRYDGKSFTNFTEKDGVKCKVFWTIYTTKQGELLFAGEDPGEVYKFNGTSFERVY